MINSHSLTNLTNTGSSVLIFFVTILILSSSQSIGQFYLLSLMNSTKCIMGSKSHHIMYEPDLIVYQSLTDSLVSFKQNAVVKVTFAYMSSISHQISYP